MTMIRSYFKHDLDTLYQNRMDFSFSTSSKFPIHQYMLDTFLEAIGRGEINGNNMKVVTTKEIYIARMDDLLTPPKVELKFPLVNFQELVYPRIKHAVLEVKQRDLLFTIFTQTEGGCFNREELMIRYVKTQLARENHLCRILSTSSAHVIK